MITADNPYFLVWIVCCTALSWLINSKWLFVVFLLMSVSFLSLYSLMSLPVLALLTFFVGFITINKKSEHKLLFSAIALCFFALFLYRFIVDTESEPHPVVLLGFAFYILRAIHILLESYTNRLVRLSWPDLIAYLWFLPTLQIGPIHRIEPFRRDLLRRRWDSELFAKGMERILFGYVKIVLIADYLVNLKMSAWINSLDSNGWWYHYLDSVHYGLNLYFKFAGYSDIAIGFSLMMGFKVMENFNFPFLATNILDFWQRWHISLSSWCRDYIYFPVFSRFRIPALAAVATMLVLGLWHELSMRYLLWGAWHGIGIAVCQRWQKTDFAIFLNQGWQGRLWLPVAGFLTINFVILSFTITGTDSMGELLQRWTILIGR